MKKVIFHKKINEKTGIVSFDIDLGNDFVKNNISHPEKNHILPTMKYNINPILNMIQKVQFLPK